MERRKIEIAHHSQPEQKRAMDEIGYSGFDRVTYHVHAKQMIL